MVVDTSAIAAILFSEPEAPELARAIVGDPVRLVSAATILEASVVVERDMGTDGGRELDLFLYRSSVEIVPFTADHLRLARSAYRRYGRGYHPAGLNLGDCFSYALSMATGEPLLYKGGDFARTDVRSCLPTP